MRRLLLIAVLFIAACGGSDRQVELSGRAMGTQFSVKFPQGIGDRDSLVLQGAIEDSLDAVEDMMSTYRLKSEISRFNASATTDWYVVSIEFCTSIEDALRISALTDGAFDITVGPLVNLWGFGPGDYIEEPPSDASIDAQLARVGFEHLHADCAQPAIRKDVSNLLLDMSAFGKGYAVDRIGELLDSLGFGDYLIEVGGELRLRGLNAENQPWAVGIEVPLPGERRPHRVLRVTDTTVATSGDYRNFFEYEGKLYSHTIDTRSGRPVTHSLASVTVVNDIGAEADALATALLVLGPEDGLALANREGLAALFLMRHDDEIEERATDAFEQLMTS